jgi:nucleoside-diphosphate-sugar epimerase
MWAEHFVDTVSSETDRINGPDCLAGGAMGVSLVRHGARFRHNQLMHRELSNAASDSEKRRPKMSALLPSPALVLGATSLVGRFLIKRLVDTSVKVLAASRRPQAPTPGITWIVGDLTGLDLRFDEATQLAFSVSPIWLLPRVLPNLKALGVGRLVAFSSTSRFTKERSPVADERAVAELLAIGEAETRSFCEEHAIAWTILRPTLIYAEGQDRSITRLANLIRRFGVLPLAGDGAGKRQPVHADDLAVGALAAAGSPAAENRAYDVPGGETLSYRLMVERIFQGLGRSPRVVSVPPVLWRLALTLTSPLLPGITTAMGSRMAEDLIFDPAPAERDFSWEPRDFQPVFSQSQPSNLNRIRPHEPDHD